MTLPIRRILAGTLATASLVVVAAPAAQAGNYDPNEPIICVRCGVISPIQPGWVVNPPIKQFEIGAVARP